MRKLFTHMIKATMLLLVMLAFFQGNAQKRMAPLASTDILFTIENDVQVSDRILEFDLYLKDPDVAQPFELSIVQAGILVNAAIINGGTITPTIVAGSSGMLAAQVPTAISFNTSGNKCVNIAAKANPGCGNGTIISQVGLGTRYCTVRITNSVAFAQAQANLTFNFVAIPNTQTKVYQNAGSPCSSAQVTTNATNCISHATNPILNAAPIIVTGAATSVTTTGAVLNGTVNANTTTTTTFFDYGPTTAYELGSVAGTPATVTGSVVTSVATSPAISGLTPGTIYHYRLRGTYGSSLTVNGSDQTFTTQSALPPPPTVVTTAATGISFTTATLNGTVNANTGATTVTFEYGLTIAYGSVATVPGTVTGSVVTPVSAAITGLACGTTYHFRVVGVNAGGTSNGSDLTFVTTVGTAPTVATNAATAVLPNTATLNGNVNANGTSTAVSFEYGLTTAYGTPVAGTPTPVTGGSNTPVSANISGLAPSTIYHFRCVGVNCGGTTNGTDQTFTTPAITLPTVVTNAATSVTPSGAVLNGTVTANGASTAVSFEYGLTTAYGTPVPGTPTPVLGTTPTAVSANISGLLGNTLYHYRCVGVNSSGTTNGNDMTFTTPCPPAGPAGPITGPTQVCQGGTGYVYTVTIPNATGYVWTLPPGGTITSGVNTNSITVTYSPTALSGYVFVYGTSSCGNGSPSQLGVAMNAPATPTISGPASACINSTTNVYTTQAGMTSYVWTVSAGAVITAGAGTNSITVTYNTVGAKTVTVNYNNANGCAGLVPASYTVTVNPLPVPTITGPTPACTNFPVVYTTETGMTGYVWTVSAGGTITGGQGTSSANVTWTTTGAKTITVNYINTNGCTAPTATVKNVTVNGGASPTITGMTNICITSGYITYTTETGMTGYIWQISPGGVINYGQGTNSVMATWTAPGNQWIRVSYTNANGCAPPTPTQLNVLVNPYPGPAGVITGASAICGGATGIPFTVNPVLNAASYVWALPAGATIATGAGTNSITVDFAPNSTPGNITVYGNNVCGNGPLSPPHAIEVSPVPGDAGTIVGPALVCKPSAGIVYSVEEIPGAVDYAWVVLEGATIVAGANTNVITVDFAATAVAGPITVYGTNDCGNGNVSPSLNVTFAEPPAAPIIYGSDQTLTSSVATGNQWYREGVLLAGETGQTLDASLYALPGWFWDVVLVGDCSSDTSNNIYVFPVGINDLTSGSFNIYPIPNDGRFTVSIVSQSKETYTISVFNNIGMKIFEEGNVQVNGTLNKVINLKPLAQGIYSVVLQNGKNHFEKKILVNK